MVGRIKLGKKINSLQAADTKLLVSLEKKPSKRPGASPKILLGDNEYVKHDKY